MKKVIFITGTGRSGSTLLDRMLGNTSKAFSVGEMYAFFRPFRPHHLLSKDKKCFCDDETCDFWYKIKKSGEKNVYNTIFEKMDIEFIIDSSKNIFWIMDQMKYKKNYKIIHLITYKNPLDYAYSRYKRNNLKGWEKDWEKTHLQLFYQLDKFATVNYKELAQFPSKKLRSVCKYIGMKYEDGMEKFWNNSPKHFLFGSGTLRNSKKKIYYKNQFEKEKIDYLKRNFKFDKTLLNTILCILEGFEVDSSDETNKSIIKLKGQIKKLDFTFQIYGQLISTRNYAFNKFMYNFLTKNKQ